jgi:hypothetical protein
LLGLGHRRDPTPRYRRDGKTGKPADEVGPQYCGVGHDDGSPVVADDSGLLRPELVDECDDVADEVEYRILVDRIGAVGGAVAALVRRDYAVSSSRERVNLVPPGVPGLRPAVQEQDEGPIALLGDVHGESIEPDVAAGYQDSLLDRSGVGRLDQSEWGLRRYFSPVAARWQRRITSGSSASAREISPV